MMEELLQPHHGGNQQLQELQHVEQRHVGMFSHKMSIITIFGHKYFKQNCHQKIGYFS